jgi:purine-binding chemotaxis protein CheW
LPLGDLRLPLGINDPNPAERPEDARRFLVLEAVIGGEPTTVAVMADIVHEVATIPSTSIEPLPATSMWPSEFVEGLFKGPEGEFVLIPDLSAIFSAMAQRAAVA